MPCVAVVGTQVLEDMQQRIALLQARPTVLDEFMAYQVRPLNPNPNPTRVPAPPPAPFRTLASNEPSLRVRRPRQARTPEP